MPSPEEILAAGRLVARKAAPYFRSMLLSFVVRPAPGLGTVACTKRGHFLYDPEFVSRVSAAQMGGLWIHETMHRLLRHFDREHGRDPRMLNMAGDLAINPSILDMGLELPPGGLFPEALGFPRGLTMDEYYELLRAEVQQAASSCCEGDDGEGDCAGTDGAGSGDAEGEDGDEKDGEAKKGAGGHPKAPSKPHAAGGWCGSCAGHEVDGEPDDSDAEGRSDAELARIGRQVAEAIREASKARGTVPAGWDRWAAAALEPPKIPWRQKLARATRSACAWTVGAVDHRYDAPGRRQAGLGYGLGKPIMPRLRRPVPRVSVAVDTSGSMGPKELHEALTEVRGVLEAVGAEVDFCSCDAEVHGLGKVRSMDEVAKLVKGGGGTDFRPAFEALVKRTTRPDVLVFVTDGCGPAPTTPPPGVRVIWVLMGPYRQTPATWGEVVEVDDTPKARS